MLDSIPLLKDTLGGTAPIDYWLLWKSNIGWILFGLFFTFLYFWLRVRNKRNNDPSTFKGYFKMQENFNTLIIHLVLYFVVIFVWLLEGGLVIGNLLADLLRLIPGLDLNTLADKTSYWFAKLMPKGDLNYWTAVVGYGLTEFIKKTPVLFRILKDSYKKLFGGKQ